MIRIPVFALLVIFLSPATFMHCDGTLSNQYVELDTIYSSYDHEVVPYLLYEADSVFILDRKLNETSALTVLPNGNLVTIEDENGVVYILNSQGKIIREVEFGEQGDFEGLEYYDGRLYVMESNGDVNIFNPDNPESSMEIIDTEFSGGNDVEGLGVLDGDLLVACKGASDAGSFKPTGKVVYRVDASTLQLKDVVIDVKEKELENLLHKRHESIDVHQYDPSSVAVNPVDGNIYVLSADMLLCVFSSAGKLLEVIPMQSVVFRQPEGMTFQRDGTMYISSEASGDKPRLFKFSRK